MATKKNINAVAKNAPKAKAKATGTKKASKSTAVETVETVETVVTPTDEAVIQAKSDITETAEVKVHTCTTCGIGEQTNDKGELNFSILANGKKRTICKPCQTAKSAEWTTARKDYRKVYARANFFLSLGIPTLLPNAKDWTPEYVLMTVKKDADGNIVLDRPAEDVYSEMQAEAKAIREANKAEREAIASEARAQRKAQRAAEKAERDAQRAADAEVAKAEREETKRLKAIERAEKAEQAKADREAEKALKAEARVAKALEVAAERQSAREAKALERAEASRQKALDKAAEVAASKKAAQDAANQKALAALKKPVPTPATV